MATVETKLEKKPVHHFVSARIHAKEYLTAVNHPIDLLITRPEIATVMVSDHQAFALATILLVEGLHRVTHRQKKNDFTSCP